jgi:hypothetical protein
MFGSQKLTVWASVVLLCCLLPARLLAPPLGARDRGSHEFEFNFEGSSKPTKQVTWSNLQWKTSGLCSDVNADVSIETSPLPVGRSYLPLREFRIRVDIMPLGTYVPGTDTAEGEKPRPLGNLFVSYSPDYMHWSTWQLVPFERVDSPFSSPHESEEEKREILKKIENKIEVYEGKVVVPEVEQEPYQDLLNKWEAQGVDWFADEEAAVKWILKRNPTFFDKHLPFIGYVKLRYEAHAPAGICIKRLNGRLDWMIWLPRRIDPRTVDPDRMVPWRFRAP